MILEEIYDVVDKNGNKIGKATWTEVHTKGLLHQNVHGIVFKDERRIETLIKKRSANMPQGMGLFEIAVAGHILSGYTPDKAIEKETEEELLGKVLPKTIKIKQMGSYFNHDLPNNYEIAYLYEIIYPGPFFASEESDGKAFWIGWKELLEDMKKNPKKYAQYSINAINEYLKRFR